LMQNMDWFALKFLEEFLICHMLKIHGHVMTTQLVTLFSSCLKSLWQADVKGEGRSGCQDHTWLQEFMMLTMDSFSDWQVFSAESLCVYSMLHLQYMLPGRTLCTNLLWLPVQKDAD
jgi:hypothetical protein